MAQMVMDGDMVPGKLQREQVEAIENSARRLLASLTALGQPAREALQAHTDYLAYGSAPPVELNGHIKAAIREPGGSLLSSAWDWVAALEKAAEYTAAQYNINRQTKSEQLRARGYVSLLAGRVRELTGSLPPKDRSSWFASFAASLGKHLRLPIGPRVVASGIDAAR